MTAGSPGFIALIELRRKPFLAGHPHSSQPAHTSPQARSGVCRKQLATPQGKKDEGMKPVVLSPLS